VVSLSKYHYGKKSALREIQDSIRERTETRAAKANEPLDRETIEEEVACLRDNIIEINDLLDEISNLSFTVEDRIGDLENSITVLEELL